MTGQLLIWAAGFAGGAAVGALYLGLLRAGTRALAGPRPALWFMGLAALRAALVLGALAGALTLGAGAADLVIALAGFVAARIVAIRLIRPENRRQAWR